MFRCAFRLLLSAIIYPAVRKEGLNEPAAEERVHRKRYYPVYGLWGKSKKASAEGRIVKLNVVGGGTGTRELSFEQINTIFKRMSEPLVSS